MGEEGSAPGVRLGSSPKARQRAMTEKREIVAPLGVDRLAGVGTASWVSRIHLLTRPRLTWREYTRL